MSNTLSTNNQALINSLNNVPPAMQALVQIPGRSDRIIGEKHPIYGVVFPEPCALPMLTLDPLTKQPIEVKGKRLLVDALDASESQYSIISPSYQIVDYRDSLDNVCEALDIMGVDYTVSVELPYNKGIMRATFQLPNVRYGVGTPHEMAMEIKLEHSLNQWRKAWLVAGAIVFFCSNKMVVLKAGVEFSKKHVQSLTPKDIVGRIEGTIANFEQEGKMLDSWRERLVTPTDYDVITTSLLKGKAIGKKALDVVENTVELASGLMVRDMHYRTLTLFSLYNIFTQYCTHEVKEYLPRVALENGIKEAFLPFS